MANPLYRLAGVVPERLPARAHARGDDGGGGGRRDDTGRVASVLCTKASGRQAHARAEVALCGLLLRDGAVGPARRGLPATGSRTRPTGSPASSGHSRFARARLTLRRLRPALARLI